MWLANRFCSPAKVFGDRRPKRLVMLLTGTTPTKPNRTTDSVCKPAETNSGEPGLRIKSNPLIAWCICVLIPHAK
jgi:hypothetical protein